MLSGKTGQRIQRILYDRQGSDYCAREIAVSIVCQVVTASSTLLAAGLTVCRAICKLKRGASSIAAVCFYGRSECFAGVEVTNRMIHYPGFSFFSARFVA